MCDYLNNKKTKISTYFLQRYLEEYDPSKICIFLIFVRLAAQILIRVNSRAGNAQKLKSSFGFTKCLSMSKENSKHC